MTRIIALFIGLGISAASAAAEVKVGEYVAAITRTPVVRDDKEVAQLKPGSTVQVVRVEGNRVYIRHDREGWVRADAVRTLDEAEKHFVGQLNERPEPSRWQALADVRAKQWDLLLTSLLPESATVVPVSPNEDEVAPAEIALPKGYELVRRALNLKDKKEFGAALRELDRALEVNPKLHIAVLGRGKIREALGDGKKAIAAYTEYVRREPNRGNGYEARAWLLATSQNETIRDGKQAIRDALTAGRLDQWREKTLHDTMAAAYAEAGQFKKAVAWQELAVRNVSFFREDACNARLKLYRGGTPYRVENLVTIRHEVDLDFCRELLEEHREDWPTRLKFIRRTPDNLSSFASHAKSIAQYASVAEPDSGDIPAMLKVAAQASAALFIVEQAAGKRIEVRLGDQTVVYQQPVDESLLHAGKWLEAFYLALICRENDLLDALCKTSVDKLRKSSTTHAEYRYLLVHALQGWWTEADDTGKRFVAALQATDPEANPRLAKDWTLYIDVPLIEVAFRCVTDDPRFEAALRKAVELHKQFYSANEDRRDDRDGFVSLPLAAMAALARDRELKFNVRSDYLPATLLEGKATAKAP